MLENTPDSGASGQAGAMGDGGQFDAGGSAPDRGDMGGQVGGPDLGGTPTTPTDAQEDRAVSPCTTGRLRFLEHQRTFPNVVISFDRSSSMSTAFGGGTRLNVAQQAVRDAVRPYQAAVMFGYQEFPVIPVNNQTCIGGAGCCAGKPIFPVRYNYNEIEFKMNECEMRGTCSTSASTPTAAALAGARSAFNSASNDRFILLVTDGEPSCPRGRDMMTACEDATFEVGTLNNNSNVKTVVFGVGDEVASSRCLDSMAAAGGMPRPGIPRYYAARDTATLRQSLSDVVKTIATRSCHINVLSPPDPAEQVSLIFDDNPVVRDPTKMSGWDFDGPATIQITVFGEPCEQIQAGRVRDIDVIAKCQ